MAKYSNIGKAFFHELFSNNDFDGYVLFYSKTIRWDCIKGKYSDVTFPIGFYKTSQIDNFLENIIINPNYNYYFTLNTFKNPRGKDNKPSNRKTNLFSINGIVIDIDCHHREWLVEQDFPDIKTLIDDYTLQHNLPMYDFIVKTGRGIQVYYIIKPTSSKLAFLVDIAKEQLINHYKKIVIPMPQFSVDSSASKRSSGLYRMPYTFNQSTKTESTIMYWDKPSRPDINTFLDRLSSSNDLKKNLVNSQTQNTSTNELVPNRSRCMKVIKEIEKYQSDIICRNNGHENRNRTCLVYSSFLLHMYSQQEALIKLQDFNSKYNVPLSEHRIISIFNYILQNYSNKEKTKMRFFSNKTILEMLDINSGEYNIYYTEDYKYTPYPNRNKKEIIKRKAKKEKIMKLALDLISRGESYSNISKSTGLSFSTIYRLKKDHPVNTPKPKIKDLCPWEIEGISKSTYYRRKASQKKDPR